MEFAVGATIKQEEILGMNRFLRFFVVFILGLSVGAVGVWVMMCAKTVRGDLIKLYPEKWQAVIGNKPHCKWLRSAEGRRIGLYELISPITTKSASLVVCRAREGNVSPCIWIDDTNNTGNPKTITIIGKGQEAMVCLGIDDDGKISDLSLETNWGSTNDVYRLDRDLDGIWDGIKGPGNMDMVHLRFGQEMYLVTISNGVRWAKTDRGFRRIVQENGAPQLEGESLGSPLYNPRKD